MSNKAKKINYTAPIIAILLIILIAIVTYFVSFNLNITNYVFEFNENNYMYTGEEIFPKFTLKTKAGIEVNLDNYNVEYSNNLEVGEATITVTSKNKLLSKAKAKGHFNIDPVPISKVKVMSSQAYPDGKYNILLKYKEMMLKEGVDFTVTFEKEKLTAASNNDFIITGLGKHYIDSTKIKVPTAPSPVNDIKIVSTTPHQICVMWKTEKNALYEIYECDKDGENLKFCTVTDENHFTFSNLQSSTTLYFLIKPYSQFDNLKLYANKSNVFSAYTNAPETALNIAEQTDDNTGIYLNWRSENCDYYEIEYSNNENFKNSIITTTKNQSNITVIYSKKPCYVRVRCVDLLDNNGKMLYGNWSNTKKVK